MFENVFKLLNKKQFCTFLTQGGGAHNSFNRIEPNFDICKFKKQK